MFAQLNGPQEMGKNPQKKNGKLQAGAHSSKIRLRPVRGETT